MEEGKETPTMVGMTPTKGLEFHMGGSCSDGRSLDVKGPSDVGSMRAPFDRNTIRGLEQLG